MIEKIGIFILIFALQDFVLLPVVDAASFPLLVGVTKEEIKEYVQQGNQRAKSRGKKSELIVQKQKKQDHKREELQEQSHHWKG